MFAPGGDRNLAALAPRRDPVLDRVFHERLQQHGRNREVKHSWFDIEPHPQALLVPHLLEGEIVVHGAQLVLEGHRLKLARLQRVAQQIGELGDGLAGPVGVLVNQPTQRVERIEDEMRIDLRLERPQFRLFHAGGKPQALDLGTAESVKKVVEEIDAQPADKQGGALNPREGKHHQRAYLRRPREPDDAVNDAIGQQTPKERKHRAACEHPRHERAPAELFPTPPGDQRTRIVGQQQPHRGHHRQNRDAFCEVVRCVLFREQHREHRLQREEESPATHLADDIKPLLRGLPKADLSDRNRTGGSRIHALAHYSRLVPSRQTLDNRSARGTSGEESGAQAQQAP